MPSATLEAEPPPSYHRRMPHKSALLLIDMLASAFEDESLRNCDDAPVLPSAVRLLGRARHAGTLVVHVVEDFDEAKYPPGSPVSNAYQIHPSVAPRPGEPVVRQHRYDAFLDSGLREILDREGVETVIVAGIASPWCVDNAVRRANGLGYRVILSKDAHGCTDSTTLPAATIAQHHNEILAACFAEVKPVDEVAF
ncbi:MAG: isochorismatase family protein [bacterium]